MKVALDVGHRGKRGSSKWDRGAVYGRTRESDLVMLYVMSAMYHLEQLDHIVYILCHGNYKDRQQFCLDNDIDLHMQCHLNAGKGSYGLIKLRKNQNARMLAEFLATLWEETLPVSKVKIEEMVKTNGKTPRGYSCVMSRIPSLLLEPMFLDNDKHYKKLLEDNCLFDIGKTISDAVSEWGKIDKGGE
jgi:N-acetylmuramoyl-L-alanine amidase